MAVANLISGAINIALFVVPVPLLAWLDRPKASVESDLARKAR